MRQVCAYGVECVEKEKPAARCAAGRVSWCSLDGTVRLSVRGGDCLVTVPNGWRRGRAQTRCTNVTQKETRLIRRGPVSLPKSSDFPFALPFSVV